MMKRKKISVIILLIILFISGWLYFVKGYVIVIRRGAVPRSLINDADVPGTKNIRLILDPIHLKKAGLYLDIYKSGLERPHFLKPKATVLAISGGGANGAYGAGVLCGWTESGERPVFDIVSGVSTGALIAPAAFLGPSYDSVLRDIYTNISNNNIMKQDILHFLMGERPSLMDTKPLRAILNKHVTMKVMKEIAREHRAGRRLYIITTNLDARRLVLWDMGAIALMDTPAALELFHSVMLASASIPVAFPPVMITVEANGKYYDEMHVDGSIGTQLFGALLLVGPIRERNVKLDVFLIRNGKIADIPCEVHPNVWNIADAAFSTLITWQSYGDLYRFSAMAKQGRMNLYMTFIPYDFNPPRDGGEFDHKYMNKLFKIGYDTARSKNCWMDGAGDILRPIKIKK